MADKLEDYRTELKNPMAKGRPIIYDYDAWFDGGIWRLWKGIDFDCSIDTMKNNVRHAGKNRGYAVHLFHENHYVYKDANEDSYYRVDEIEPEELEKYDLVMDEKTGEPLQYFTQALVITPKGSPTKPINLEDNDAEQTVESS